MQSTPETNELNESLGTYLRRSRESKNVSIEQVAYATRISLKMLRALEEDDHTALPAPTFVRGYLQAYAKYVRIDTQDLLLRYQHHLATAPDSKRGAIRSHYLYVRERYQEKRRLVFVIVLFGVLLSAAGAYFFLKAQREKHKRLAKTAEQIQKSEEQKPGTYLTTDTVVKVAEKAPEKPAEKPAEKQPEKAPEKATEKLAEKPAEKSAEPPKAESPKPEPPKPAPVVALPPPPPKVVESEAPEAAPEKAKDEKKAFQLLLKASEDVWFRYQTDEDEVKDLTLRTGKAMMLRANKVIKIFSGNLGALKGTFNGKEMPSLAAAKGIKSLVLPESEVANYKLPLFPQFQTKTKPSADHNAPQSDNPRTPPDGENSPPSKPNP